MDRPSRHEIAMEVADVISRRGTCERARVGATITRDGRILATGYNGPPSGIDHCSPSCFEQSITGCMRSVHAEANAIAFAARHGISTAEGHLYTTHLPCLGCAQLIINAGIRRVTFREDYRIKDGSKLLKQAGIDIMTLHDRIALERAQTSMRLL